MGAVIRRGAAPWVRTRSRDATASARRRGTSRLAAVLAGVAVAFALVTLGPPPAGPAAVAADGITFGSPTAKAVFGTGVDFSQPIEGGGAHVLRVELLVTRPGDLGPQVIEVSGPASLGSTTLHASLTEADGHIFPNTSISGQWRVTDTAGNALLGPVASVMYEDTRFDWQTATGSIVRVHWYVGDAAFGARALQIAESGIAKAENLFGVTETKPVDFYVYAAQAPFYAALGPGTRENVGGEAVAEIRTLFALITPDQINASWVGTVIPHELTHLVFNTTVHNPYHFPPRWLNEGLAVYLSQGYDASDQALVRNAVASQTLIPLSGLVGQFPTTRNEFALAYAESVSAVDYFVRTYGRDALVKLVRTYRNGVTDDEAFQAAVGLTVDAFDTAWMKSLGASPPVRYGPQPAPPGPLPEGWSSSPAPGGATGSPGSQGASPTAATSAGAGIAVGGATPGATQAPGAASAASPKPSEGSLSGAPLPTEASVSPTAGIVPGLAGLALILAGIASWLVFRPRR